MEQQDRKEILERVVTLQAELSRIRRVLEEEEDLFRKIDRSQLRLPLEEFLKD